MRLHRLPFLLACYLILALAACNFANNLTPKQTETEERAQESKAETTQRMPISEIQGAQHRSPLENQNVTNVYGIVTAITGSGFYLQDPQPDLDERTSEAIFVSTHQIGTVSVGDEVLITSGVVKEFNPAGVGNNSLTTTQIQTAAISILSNENTLPEPIILGEGGRAIPNQVITNDVNGYAGKSSLFDPQEDGLDFYESLEGMRVQVNHALAISPTSKYREVVVVADNGRDATELSSRGVLVLRPDDVNPERILVDDAFINIPDIQVGAQFTQPIIGIISYDFGNFRLLATEKLNFSQGNPIREAITFSLEENQLTVATYNVENLDIYTYPERLEQLAEDIVLVLGSPDILALQEVLDDDGTLDSMVTSSAATLAALAEAIRQTGGPQYAWLSIDPQRNADGGVVGGNIRNVLLYRQDRGVKPTSAPAGDAFTAVEVLVRHGEPQLSINPGRISPNSFAFTQSRKPLAAQFSFHGEIIFVIANHLNSKGEDGTLYGDIQPPPLLSEVQRIQQAQIIHDFVAQLLAIDVDAKVIVLGDLNDFPWSAPVQILAGKELENLIERLPKNERYTYLYQGNAEVLDHILVSSSLKEKISFFDIIHINAEMLPAMRLSDHDPVIAVLNFD
jgi:hypothetical protein